MPNTALGGLSETRRKIVLLIKADGELTVDELADSLGITRSAVRQHVAGLEADGLLDHVTERGRPGRPRFRYVLTRAAERLFPGRTDEVFVEVLDALDQREPGRSAELFRQHFARRADQLPNDCGDRSIEAQVSQLVKVLEQDGHMPLLEATSASSWRLTSTNCPLARVAEGRSEVCDAELEFFRAVVPAAQVECARRIGDGKSSCVHLLSTQGA